MTCPICGGKSNVYWSAAVDNGSQINRRRMCTECGWKFRTVEVECGEEEVTGIRYRYDGVPLVDLNRRNDRGG